MEALKGKIAIVTGASRSQGIGSTICLMLAKAGADIFFTHWSDYDENEGVGIEKGYPVVLQEKIKDLRVLVIIWQLICRNQKHQQIF